METLTKTEEQLIDNFILRNVKHELTSHDFNLALCNCLPSWRSEELIGDSVYTGTVAPIFPKYLENLIKNE